MNKCRSYMKYNKIFTFLLGVFLVCSSNAQEIRYNDGPAELSIALVSDKTIEIELSPLDGKGDRVEPPQSEILVDYPRKELWRGRQISALTRLTAGQQTI